MNTRNLWLLPLLSGCGKGIVDDMQVALSVSNDAIAAALIAAEASAWVDATSNIATGTTTSTPTTGTGTPPTTTPPGSRHGAPGDCPRISREPDEGAPFTLFADYRTGCVSGSGLVPAVLSGVMELQGDDGSYTSVHDSMDIALARPILGTIEGTFSDSEQPRVTGDILLPETEDRPLLDGSLDLRIVFEPEVMHLDGTVDVGGTLVTLEGVSLSSDKISGDCPRPGSGTATLASDPELIVDYAEPAGDEVTVLRKRRASQPTNLCGWESRAF